MRVLLPKPTHRKLIRVGAVLLGVSRSQIPAEHHKDVKFSTFLDVVHSELDASLDVKVTEVRRVEAADAATDLSS